MVSKPSLRETILSCERCPELVATRTNIVVGEAAKYTKILLLGETPGKNEDASGIPFVGRSGMELRPRLTRAGIHIKKNAGIINVLKCYTPTGRTPLSEELANCKEYTVKQIEYLKPKCIIALGRYAHAFVRGIPAYKVKVLENAGRVVYYQNIPAVLTYHPSFLVRMKEKEIFEAFEQHLETARAIGLGPRKE